MKGTNLVFDFSNMAIRSMYSCVYTDPAVNSFDSQSECDTLIRKLVTDISYVVRLFSPERTILLCDSKTPWRKELFKDIEGEEYKGNRAKDETKNWENIFRAFDSCKKALSTYGILVCELKDAEADDLAAMWRQNIWDEGKNCIFVSSDKDWLQLVGSNGSNFCLCFNPIANNMQQKQKFIYYTKGYYDWLNEHEETSASAIFSPGLGTKQDIIAIVSTKDAKVVSKEIDPMGVLVGKIMCGDDGDNIPSFYHFYKNGKKTRITEKRCQKILESISASSLSDIESHAEDGTLKKAIESCFKIEITDMDAKERLMRQRKMVELEPSLFPKRITDAFAYFLEDNRSAGYIASSEVTMQDILKNTPYLEEMDKPKTNSIFDNIKGLERFIKPSAAAPATPSPLSFNPEEMNALF